MFEFFIAKKYLIPKKKQLSVSLIALMSIGVISLVVWLVLIFLSVTSGIEKTWLSKLTSLNAPLRVLPSNQYYNSYYYKIDQISSASDYQTKSLFEKKVSEKTDPYDPDFDEEIPSVWLKPDLDKNGKVLDPVKEAFSAIEQLKKEYPGLVAQEYEIAGALLKLKLIRPLSERITEASEGNSSYLTQMSYIASFSQESPYLHRLLIPPKKDDIQHLLYLSSLSQTRRQPSFSDESEEPLKKLLSHIQIDELSCKASRFQIHKDFFKEGDAFQVAAFKKQGSYSHFLVPSKLTQSFQSGKNKPSQILEYGTLTKTKEHLIYTAHKSQDSFIADDCAIFLENAQTLKASITDESIENARYLSDLSFIVKMNLQGLELSGKASLRDLEIANATVKDHFSSHPSTPPLWPYYLGKTCNLPSNTGNDHPVILPKNYQDAGVRIGDKGHLCYSVPTANAMQEQRLPIYVSSFYDPGIMSVGARCILMENEIVSQIAKASNSFLTDPLLSSGIQVWFQDISKAKEVHLRLLELFQQKGIAKYFSIKNFYEYEFAKDLMQQFQSDKYLFTLVGLIILIVACSNIISFLVIMVNDKRKEIGILQSMGASSKSIALIFALCGACLGLLGSCIGTFAAYLTMHNIDQVVSLLSMLQGHDAFHESFYGTSLPTQLSGEAVTFILITTPIISILAGLIPAIKACNVKPAHTLRSD